MILNAFAFHILVAFTGNNRDRNMLLWYVIIEAPERTVMVKIQGKSCCFCLLFVSQDKGSSAGLNIDITEPFEKVRGTPKV